MIKNLITISGIALVISLIISCSDSQGRSKLLDTTVMTRNGLVKGALNQNETVAIFKGIPFAAPPVGDLRWREPQPPLSWEGIRDATAFCSSCIQVSSRRLPWTDEYMNRDSTSEDCLFLNIWTPARSASDKLPVMVWIYGGALREGSGSIDVYNGEELAKKGIIVITINYRVGVLGFLAHPWLTAESPNGASGNYGLLDQVAALKWVKENIAAFRGDPEKVTIAGQSAGSRSVHMLTSSPLAKGLFNGAAVFSGASMGRFDNINTLTEAEEAGIKYVTSKGATNLAELRAIAPEDLIADFGISVDGWLLREKPAAVFQKGIQNDVPTIAGLVADEGSSSAGYGKTTMNEFIENAKKTYENKYEEFLSLYPANSDEEAGLMSIEVAREKGRFDLYAWAKFRGMTAKTPVFTYYFERGIPWPEHPEFRAFHTSDVTYWFNNLKMVDRPWTEADSVLGERVSSYLVNFVTTGNPNGDGLPLWPVFDENKNETLKLNTVIEPIPVAGEKKIEFFKDL